MDLTFSTEKGRFNYRVGAIIIRNNQILMATNENCDYYYSVGGRVKFDETSEQAVIREVFEETGVKMTVDRLAVIHENFFTENEHFHEISFYFYMNVPNNFEPVCMSFAEGKAKESLEWLDIEKLDEVTAYPEFLKALLKENTSEVKHIITYQENK